MAARIMRPKERQLGLFGELPIQRPPPRMPREPRPRGPSVLPVPSHVLTGSDDRRLLRDPDAGRPIGCVIRRGGGHYEAHAVVVGKLPTLYRTQQEAEIAVQREIKRQTQAKREAKETARPFALYRK
jgi:hypothetical protein